VRVRIDFDSDIEISSAQRRIPGFARKYQVEFSVGGYITGDEEVEREEGERDESCELLGQYIVFVGPCPSLYAVGLNLFSDGDESSAVLVNIYRRHRLRKRRLVGCLKDTVGGLVGRLKDGGVQSLCLQTMFY
jgi:hypothetical protein